MICEFFEKKKVRLSLLGRHYVGKSSILERYLTNSYIEAQFIADGGFIPKFSQKYFHENEVYNSIQIWDDDITVPYINLKIYESSIKGVLLVYNITWLNSFKLIQETSQFIETGIKDKEKKPIIYVVGSGSDRETKRKVSKDEAIDFCNKHNYKYFECSALTGYNIHEIISYMIRDITERELYLSPKNKFEKVKKNYDFNKKNKFGKDKKCVIF